ncbi:MAG: NAD(P)H-hydrate epimerase, partial [Hyphomicrobium sp.]
MHELLTTEEMAEADRRAVSLGVPSLTLMERAGRAVADEAASMASASARILVLCGPGNNGGDGFVAARHLRDSGFDVRLALLGARAQLKGDAAGVAGRWPLAVHPARFGMCQSMDLIIDALFGAGLSRPLEGLAAELVRDINDSGVAVLSVDVPSGLNGTTGASDGPVVHADHTVTFFRKKPGHLL